MYIKLAERCKSISLNGINMLGCPRSHAVLGLTEEGSEFVKRLKEGADIDVNTLSDNNRRLLEEMDKRGFFHPDIPDFRTKSAYLHITSRCNMNCTGCYSHSNGNYEANISDLPPEQIYYIVDNLVEAGFKTLIISGGEPFLYKDIIAILDYMKSKGCKVDCISNGTASEEMYETALKSLNNLSFSMDGYDEESSILRRSMAKRTDTLVRTFAGQNANVSVIFTLHKKNYHLYQQMQEYAKELGVPYNYSLFTAERNAQNDPFLLEAEEFISLSKQFDSTTNIMDSSLDNTLSCRTCCGAGKTRISISASGDIYPCHMMHQEEFLMGNALKDKISSVINRVPSEGYFSVDKKTECKDCKYAYLCGGGCLYRAYALNGSLSSRESLCELYKQQIDQILAPFTKKCDAP